MLCRRHERVQLQGRQQVRHGQAWSSSPFAPVILFLLAWGRGVRGRGDTLVPPAPLCVAAAGLLLPAAAAREERATAAAAAACAAPA